MWITDREESYVASALHANGEISTYIDSFEQALLDKIGRNYAIATHSGSVALEIALRALGVKAGDEVIIPALCPVAPAAAVLQLGAIPVLVDVDPITWTLDPLRLAEAVNRNTRAMIVVDLLGHPADFDALRQAAPRLSLIEDASQAHGAAYKGVLCGGHGTLSIFSFGPTKTVSTGEGGAILTNNTQLAERVRALTQPGEVIDIDREPLLVGVNARMSGLNAAVGLAQIERWDELVKARVEVDKTYRKLLKDVVGFRQRARWAKPSCYQTTLTVEDKDSMVKALIRDQVNASSIWTPLCNLQSLEARYDYPVAQELGEHVLFLPTNGQMTSTDCENVAQSVRLALESAHLAVG